jgi:hypothetical protein
MGEEKQGQQPINRTVIAVVILVLLAIGMFKVWDRWMFYREFHRVSSEVEARMAEPLAELDLPQPPPPPPPPPPPSPHTAAP